MGEGTERRIETEETEEDPQQSDPEWREFALDYRVGIPFDESDDGDLIPAWEPNSDPASVGYEPIGETSIGVEAERRGHASRSRYRVPATRLNEHHEGRHPSDGRLGKRLARNEKKRITQALGSYLGLSPTEQSEAVRAVLLMDLARFGSQKRLERIALATIAVVVDYHRRYRTGSPEAERISADPFFKNLSHEHGLAGSQMQLSRMVKVALIEEGYFNGMEGGLGFDPERLQD